MSTTFDTPTPPNAGAARMGPLTRNGWLLAGGLAITGLGLAAGLAWRPAPPSELASPGSVEATRASLAANEAVLDSNGKPVTDKSIDRPAQGTPVPLVSGRNGQGTSNTTPAPRAPARQQGSGSPQQYANSSGTSAQAAAPICTHCGVIESVREVTIKGKGTGLGAVAGGVLGGAVGNQIGHGNGRAAMTVLGAIGGGLAGNEVEKRARSERAYEVRVRMDDGTVRTFQQQVAPPPGARVTVDGKVLHVTRGTGGAGDGQAARTTAG